MPDLEQKNITLEARNAWLESVNRKMIVMIQNASDVLEEYVKGLEEMRDQMQITQRIYAKLSLDLEEAFNEKPTDESSS